MKEEILKAFNKAKKEMSEDSPEMQKYMALSDKMFEHSGNIVAAIADPKYIKDGDEEWALSMLMALARATCYIIRGLEESSKGAKDDIFETYVDVLLPLCDAVVKKTLEEKLKDVSNE